MTTPTYQLEQDPRILTKVFDQIRSLADANKDSLGFLPSGALEDAIFRRRLFAMVDRHSNETTVAGYILFSGVYPRARVQQIAVHSDHQQMGIASALLTALVSSLEKDGYLTISARPASDLSNAQKLYEKHGFSIIREIDGGRTRGRKITVREKVLETDSLFGPKQGTEILNSEVLQQLSKNASSPYYVIDLNVLFDLIKNRPRAPAARKLFGAALAHQIRLAVSPEFIREIRRTSFDVFSDEILSLACQLPRLPQVRHQPLEEYSNQIHKIIFEDKQLSTAFSKQALSDAKHVAYSVLCKASSYVTSDKAILNARPILFEKFGIDVASLDELLDILPEETDGIVHHSSRGQGFDVQSISAASVVEYLRSDGVPDTIIETFSTDGFLHGKAKRLAIIEGQKTIGIGVSVSPKDVISETRLLVHIRSHAVNGQMYASYLIDLLVNSACLNSPAILNLVNLSGQAIVKRMAMQRGFQRETTDEPFSKIALGRPITPANWDEQSKMLQRKTGITLEQLLSTPNSLLHPEQDTDKRQISWDNLERALSPTAVAWPGRLGVIQPIQKEFADELLGTSLQYSLLEQRDAAFLSRRAYVGTPRSANVMKSGKLIFFYESKKRNGRGGIVAVARIIDVLVTKKDRISDKLARELVVEGVEKFSQTKDVLHTSFDNLLVFPNLCSLGFLRDIGAEDGRNFVTATSITDTQVQKILKQGWSGNAS